MKGSIAVRSPTTPPIVNTNSTTNITTTYIVLSSSMLAAASEVSVQNSSAVPVVLAIGASGAEVDKIAVNPGVSALIPLTIKKGDRLVVKAISASASTGFLSVSFLG